MTEWFDNMVRVTMNDPVTLGSGGFFLVHHSQVFDTLVCIHPATEDQLILQYCEDRVGPSEVDTEDELLEVCFRISARVADLINANILTKHGDILRPA